MTAKDITSKITDVKNTFFIVREDQQKEMQELMKVQIDLNKKLENFNQKADDANHTQTHRIEELNKVFENVANEMNVLSKIVYEI